MTVYEEIYLQLDHIESLYGCKEDGDEMCALANKCEDLTSILYCLGNGLPRISRDVKDLFHRCIGHMCVILLNEEDDSVKQQGEECVKKLARLLMLTPAIF